MALETTVHVKGLRELQVALKKLGAEVNKVVTDELRIAAEPVRASAESKAAQKILNIGGRWGAMKIGVTTKVIYVAPKARRRGGSPRPNLAKLLLNDAMQPALDENAPEIFERVDRALDRLGGECGF